MNSCLIIDITGSFLNIIKDLYSKSSCAYSGAYFHGLCPKIAFFLNISNLSKTYLIDFFYSVSNFGPAMVQLKYQSAKRLKFFFLVI